VPPARRPGAPIDPRELSLARALVEDISLTLARSRHYDVIAPFTARQLAGRPAEYVHSAVAADYLVRIGLGTRTGVGDYTLLVLELEGRSGEIIHRDELELRPGLLPDLHFGLCATVADRISGRIAREELVQFRHTGAASAYVHYLLAMDRSDRSDLAALLRAQKSLARSLHLAPDYVPALSELARTKTLEWIERGTTDRGLLLEARHLAERAQAYEPADSASLREIGHAALYLHDLDTALTSYEAAAISAPNHADILADQADVLTHASRHVEAEARIARALALNPLAPDDYYWIGGAVSFFRGRYAEALARLTTMKSPGLALRLMAASAAMAGEAAAAATYRDGALAHDPSFTVDKWTSLYPQPALLDTRHYLEALRRAGFR
jgi:hypothetical protein